MPEKPKSLADEIEPLLWTLVDYACEWGRAQATRPIKSGLREASIGNAHAVVETVKSRLTAIESELNDYRQKEAVKRAWWEANRRGPHGSDGRPLPPRIESHSALLNGLPCSSTIDSYRTKQDEVFASPESFHAFTDRVIPVIDEDDGN